MSSLLYDDFLYRWFSTDEGFYYGSASGQLPMPFPDDERGHHLSRIIGALLTHDRLYIRIGQFEEFIRLVGVVDTLFQFLVRLS